MPQIRHAVYANPARSNAPPTPPTTPPIVFLAVSLSPELPPLPPPFVSEAGSTLVVMGTTLLDVLVMRKVLPALTLVIVVMTSWVSLVVMRVREGVEVVVLTVGAAVSLEDVSC